jgi:hypothetical protein
MLDPLGDLLLRLYRKTQEEDVSAYKPWALKQTAGFVPFDMAIWAMGSDRGADRPVDFHEVLPFRLPTDFVPSWERLQIQTDVLRPVLADAGRCFSRVEAVSELDSGARRSIAQHEGNRPF